MDTMKRTVIVIGAGQLQIPLIEKALEMDLKVIAFDMSADAPGMKLASECVIMSTRDIDGCVREAKKLSLSQKIDGVITAGTDASKAVSAIAAALDLTGIRYNDAEAASNKVLMRKRLRQHGVPVPDFFPVWSLKEARDAVDEIGTPAVIKPAENMGARGVVKIESRDQVAACYKHAKKYSTTGELILESYMPGPELSVDALAFNGKIYITGIADRIISGEPYFIELGHNMPSAQPGEVLKEVEEVMKSAMQAIGISNGAAKGDIKVTPDGVKIGEIAARLSGGWMSAKTYPYSTGVDLLKAAIQICMGDEPDDLNPKQSLIAIERGILSSPGKITAIEGVESASKVKRVREIILSRSIGDTMQPVTSNIDKAGHVIAVAGTLEEAEKAAASALSLITVEVDETAALDWKRIEATAREKFGDQVCWVCRVCDGANCASTIPGMGGTENNKTFQDNSIALSEYKIVPSYIRPEIDADTSVELFGRKFEMPVMVAPMTGASTNMNSALTEGELAARMIQGAKEAGTIAFIGDGASPDRYKEIFEAAANLSGFTIAILKPRDDEEAIYKRFRIAEESGFIAVGMDIDAIRFRTMRLRKQKGLARDNFSLSRIRSNTYLPFIIKGIMSVDDAKYAVDTGADAIVVSNHGGRVLDDMPGTARVLPGIVNEVGDKIDVLVDGGARNGRDIFKFLSLGAKAVLVGRPAAIAAVGGGFVAVRSLFEKFQSGLKETMNLCGADTVGHCSGRHIMYAGNLHLPDTGIRNHGG